MLEISLTLIYSLLSVSLLLQTFEYYQLRPTYLSVWNWGIIRDDFQNLPRPARGLLDLFLSYPNLNGLLLLQAFLCLGLWVSPLSAIGLLCTSLLLSLRWRGIFNGGSDVMTLQTLLVLSFIALFPAYLHLGLLYLALQVTASYFIAGWVKFKNPLWRNGEALRGFLSSYRYQPPQALSFLKSSRLLSLLASWGILAFELSFPIVLIKPSLLLIYLPLGGTFHLINVYVFGLNRFFFAWIAAYPSFGVLLSKY